MEEREFVLEQLEASVLAGTIVTSTGKLSRHMKAFAVILEEKGDAADLDKYILHNIIRQSPNVEDKKLVQDLVSDSDALKSVFDMVPDPETG